MSRTELEIEGMTCQSCAVHVRDAFERAGVGDVDVDWRHGRATINGESPSRLQLNAALAGTRYEVKQVREPAVANGAGAARKRRGDYDLIVLGSGSGAFAAAIRARDLGRRVVLIEQGTIGGTCVNVGCIPSKSLLVASRRGAGAPDALAHAVSVKAALVERLRREKYIALLDEYGIELRPGTAGFVDAHTVDVEGERLTADAVLVAVGARPAVPAIDGLSDSGYLTSTTALDVTVAPRRLAVIGAGAVGLELGQMFGNFGSAVTFIARRAVASHSEPEVSQVIRQQLERDGHTVLEHARTDNVRLDDGEKVLAGSVGSERFEIRVDEILIATGRDPNTEALGLDAVGVETTSRGAIVVDELQRTSVDSIYAAGDVTDQPQFVYVAAAGGAAAAQNALSGGHETLDFTNLPRIIFTNPQIAAAGLTEREAREQGLDVDTTVLPLEAVPRALVNGETGGLFKLVAETGSGRLLGASVIADAAGEVIQSAVVAIKAGMAVDELASTWAPYLTMAEGLKLAAQTFDRDVAKLSCCAA